MPTIMTLYGLRVVIYPNDHRPAHVHIIGKGCEAVFNLHCPYGPPALRENYSFSQGVLRGLSEDLMADVTLCCSTWRRIHETDI